MSRLHVHVGGLRDMGRRFVDAWHRAEQGERFSETHVTFLDLFGFGVRSCFLTPLAVPPLNQQSGLRAAFSRLVGLAPRCRRKRGERGQVLPFAS
jgi:hypothetical protein